MSGVCCRTMFPWDELGSSVFFSFLCRKCQPVCCLAALLVFSWGSGVQRPAAGRLRQAQCSSQPHIQGEQSRLAGKHGMLATQRPPLTISLPAPKHLQAEIKRVAAMTGGSMARHQLPGASDCQHCIGCICVQVWQD
jgi:hypothetical protein